MSSKYLFQQIGFVAVCLIVNFWGPVDIPLTSACKPWVDTTSRGLFGGLV